jgi:DHA3 family macrolide efflux protein-like MFS transporter
MSGSIYNASFVAVIQIRVAPEILGRVFSVFGSVNLLPAMIGLLGTGYVADAIGVGRSFLISGGIICLIGAISYLYPAMLALGKDDS